MKKKLIILLLGVLLILSGCGLIYAMISVDVTNHFETGIVDITLTEYQKVGDTEILWEDNPTVMPGDIVSKIPRIHNDGNDCYIRAKLAFRDTDEVSEDNLLGITDKWVKADDGYYYYTEILPHGEDTDIFRAVSIPDDLPEDTQGQTFYIDIDVDAIQSKNFTPQFNTAAPWGSVEILDCGKEGQYDISTFKQSDTQSFRIEYQGGIERLVKNSDDFFSNFPYLMPGDTYSDSASIVNDGDEDMKVYFRSAAEDPSDLLDKIQLTITTEIDGVTKVFYQGCLRAPELADNVILGIIPANSVGQFRFEISVPSELNNQYTIQDSLVKWIFSTEFIPNPSNPTTGEDPAIRLSMGLMAVSIVGMGFIIIAGTNKKRREYDG